MIKAASDDPATVSKPLSIGTRVSSAEPRPNKTRDSAGSTDLDLEPELHQHDASGQNTSVSYALQQAGLRIGLVADLLGTRSFWSIGGVREALAGCSRAVMLHREEGYKTLDMLLNLEFPEGAPQSRDIFLKEPEKKGGRCSQAGFGGPRVGRRSLRVAGSFGSG